MISYPMPGSRVGAPSGTTQKVEPVKAWEREARFSGRLEKRTEAFKGAGGYIQQYLAICGEIL